MANTLKNLNFMQISGQEKYGIGLDKVSHFPDMNILDDLSLFYKLLAKKRSTFDRSKFTVVGSPTITDDGIASGFSSSNRVNLLNNTLLNNIKTASNWEIDCCFKTPNPLTPSVPILFTGNINVILYGIGFTIKDSKLRIALGNNWSIANGIMGNTVLNTNTVYYAKLGFTGTTYYVNLSDDGINFTNEITITSSTKLTTAPEANAVINGGFSDYTNWLANIDLKQFSLKINGVEVFNGNKTGIDQIKKNDYEKVGDVIVTDDGIANFNTYTSTEGTRNCLAIDVTDFKGNSWEINVPVYIDPEITTGIVNGIEFAENTPENQSFYWQNPYGGVIRALCKTGTTSENANIIKYIEHYSSKITKGIFNLKMKFDITTGIYSYYFNKENEPEYKVYDIIPTTTNKELYVLNTQSKVHLYIGNNGLNGSDTQIDLNKVKIYINGELKHQPTLRIPYTQSKTNEKIVDATYRDRVQDMYEQFGYTHYYTIGDVPEKYNVTKVGNPTLVGGVASGFSDNNMLQYFNNIPIYYNTLRIITPKFKRTIISQDYTERLINTTNWEIIIDRNGVRCFGDIYGIPQVGQEFYFDITINNGLATVLYYVDNILVNTKTHDVSSFNFTKTWNIGNYAGLLRGFQGSIDLSQFSIEVDGKEIFRCYEPMITDTFTLATHKNCDVIDSYYDVDGMTSYELTADLQQTVTGGGMSAQTITLARPFKDNKYICTKGTSAKTATTLTLSENGTFIAKGLGVLG